MNDASGSRVCPHCAKEISAKATRCKYCYSMVAIAVESPLRFAHELEASSTKAVSSEFHPPVAETVTFGLRALKRYRDAYAIASGLEAQGQTIKSLAVVVAVIVSVMTLVTFLAAIQAGGKVALGTLIAGGITAGVLWSFIHANGVRIAAQGQHLLAALDVAVHTSPFLSNSERAQAMSL